MGRPEENSMTGAVNKWPQCPSESRKHICWSGRSASLFSSSFNFLQLPEEKNNKKTTKLDVSFVLTAIYRRWHPPGGDPTGRSFKHNIGSDNLWFKWNIEKPQRTNRGFLAPPSMTKNSAVGLADPWPLSNRKRALFQKSNLKNKIKFQKRLDLAPLLNIKR